MCVCESELCVSEGLLFQHGKRAFAKFCVFSMSMEPCRFDMGCWRLCRPLGRGCWVFLAIQEEAHEESLEVIKERFHERIVEQNRSSGEAGTTSADVTVAKLAGEARPLESRSRVSRQNPNSQCAPVKLGLLAPEQRARPVPTLQQS